ncbi:LAFE_0E06260g1_1 [Lachancea fermentati]|uniref:LAFE_0E06260g1_1 n=1 Tax=Lachancea fermentati TaxID=4955 RepID=A0A1G4MCW7_LACFM|nr:LAFE_0E06260g1_1 [Lachancea fermentati]
MSTVSEEKHLYSNIPDGPAVGSAVPLSGESHLGISQNGLKQQKDALRLLRLEFYDENDYKCELIKKRRREILKDSQELKTKIKPMEFESYEDYYLIHNFKRGISASGKVDVDSLRTRATNVYYKRIKRGNVDNQDKNNEDDSSDSEDDELKDKSFRPNRRTTRAQKTKLRNESNVTDTGSESASSENRITSNRIVGDISVDSIIPTESNNSVRRSSRLSQREKEILERRGRREYKSGVDDSFDDKPEILDLYELIVAKIPEPVRRSDWVLPSKYKFIPEKFTPVKHTPEQVKINDLIHNDRIRKVLTRFKGGLAGIKKKDWVTVKASEEDSK